MCIHVGALFYLFECIGFEIGKEIEEDLKLDQFYLGFRPTVDTALIPVTP